MGYCADLRKRPGCLAICYTRPDKGSLSSHGRRRRERSLNGTANVGDVDKGFWFQDTC